MRASHVGLLAGLAVGIVWSWLGFGALVLTLFCGLAGWFIALYLTGGLDLQRLFDAFRRR
jgi:ribose/xylose/arabinose/galactoside ABC-type transport system permease subunit